MKQLAYSFLALITASPALADTPWRQDSYIGSPGKEAPLTVRGADGDYNAPNVYDWLASEERSTPCLLRGGGLNKPLRITCGKLVFHGALVGAGYVLIESAAFAGRKLTGRDLIEHVRRSVPLTKAH